MSSGPLEIAMPRAARALLVAPLLALAACAASNTAASAPATTAHSHGDQAASGQVPATARMICRDEIKGKVEQALSLDAPPATHDSWVAGVYTRHYALPMGEMSLSDRVFPDAAAARAHLASTRSQDGTAQPLAGLGHDATHQRPSDLAYEAADVLGCWTGDE
jgi:hypothetical protein